MVTVVWGRWYLDAHLDLNLPSLLAPQNLPMMAAEHDLTYVLMTIAADHDRLARSPAVLALKKILNLDLRIIPDTETRDPIGAHQRAWTRATEEAKRSNSYVLYMPPDVAWSDGSFAHLSRLLARDYTAIFMTYLRVVSETFVPAMRARGATDDIALRLSGRELVALSLDHVHPLMAAHMHDSRYFPVHPEMVVWPVPGQGLGVRCLAREMFLFDPGRIDMGSQLLVDGRFNRRDMVFVDDSDDLYAVSLAPLGKDIGWHLTPGPPDLASVARWWLIYDSPVNDLIAASFLRWHPGPVDAARWERRAMASHRWMRRQTALREALRLWQSLIEAKAWNAATLLALAIETRAVANAFPATDRPTVVLVPDEARIDAVMNDATTNRAALLDLLRRHVAFVDAPPRQPIEEGTWCNAAGEQLQVKRVEGRLSVNGCALLDQGQRVGRHLVCRIDGLIA
ncbi:MAG: hypothetical protein JNM30_18950 [Rhodospirillales bacterium]|nr:hypothetical protein [Rhodospirillales bacterium]